MQGDSIIRYRYAQLELVANYNAGCHFDARKGTRCNQSLLSTPTMLVPTSVEVMVGLCILMLCDALAAVPVLKANHTTD